MSINERFKSIRNELQMNQSEFGLQIGVSRDVIANIEGSRISPKDIHILSVCRNFHIDEDWLRTGEGEMYSPVSRDEEIAAFVGSVAAIPDSFKARFISMLSKLDESEWELLEHMAELMANEKEQD